MKEYKVYVCEKCGQEFTEGYPEGYNNCQKHEASHVVPEFYAIRDNSSYQPGDTYPRYIRIPMSDGAEIMYQFESVAPTEEKESPQEAD
jgi:hypothetical protein